VTEHKSDSVLATPERRERRTLSGAAGLRGEADAPEEASLGRELFRPRNGDADPRYAWHTGRFSEVG